MSGRFADLAHKGPRHKGRSFGTLWSDGHGSGDVTLFDWFDHLPAIERADLLKDAIYHLENEYRLTLDELRSGGKRQ